MCCVFDGREPSRTCQLLIPPGFYTAEDTLETLWMVRVIVMLVDDENNCGRVDDGDP